MSQSDGSAEPRDQEGVDPDGDPELMNPRDDRAVDDQAITDPDEDPGNLNPRDDRPAPDVADA